MPWTHRAGTVNATAVDVAGRQAVAKATCIRLFIRFSVLASLPGSAVVVARGLGQRSLHPSQHDTRLKLLRGALLPNPPIRRRTRHNVVCWGTLQASASLRGPCVVLHGELERNTERTLE